MIVYIAMLVTTLIILYGAEKTYNKNIKIFLYFLAVIPFIVVSGIRYDLGTDYSFRYVPDYNSIANGEDVVNLEFGFKLLIKLCILFTNNPQILFVITSIIINALFFYVVYKYSKNIIYSIIILFFNGFFFSSLNIVRQCLAISIILIGYTFLIKEDNIKRNILYIIFLFIAFSIHKSSIITASFLFFTRRNIMNWKWVIPCTILVLLLGEKLLIPLKELLKNTKYSVYFLEKFLESDVSIIYLIENTIIYILMNIKYYYDKKNNRTNKEEIIFLNIEGLCLLITALAKCHVVFDRLALYCLSFQILSIPFFMEKIKEEGIIKEKLEQKHYLWMMILITIMFISIFTKTNILNNNGEVVPYKTIFNKNYEIR